MSPQHSSLGGKAGATGNAALFLPADHGHQKRFGKEGEAKRDAFRSGEGDSTRSESSEEEQAAHTCKTPSQLSLMLSDDPHNSLVLMLYLKRYSELLFSWGETVRAVQACKLVASACQLLEEYQQSKAAASKSVSGLGDDEMTMAIREDANDQPRIYRRVHDGRLSSTDEHPQGPDHQPVLLATSSFG